MVAVVRISDGAIESSLSLEAGSGGPQTLMPTGSWLGDRVVADSDAGLVVLNVKDGLRIESIFKTSFPHGVIEPTFTDETHIIGWADTTAVPVGLHAEPAYENTLVSCDLRTLECTAGPSVPGRTWTRWVTNPSR
jgi:hypothetical protein